MRKPVADSLQESQSLSRVSQLTHQIELGEVDDSLVAYFESAFQPFSQDAKPRPCRLVDPAPGPAFRGSAPAVQQTFALQFLQRGINLAQLGGPEIVNAIVHDAFQVVAAGRFAQQAEQDVLEAHAASI